MSQKEFVGGRGFPLSSQSFLLISGNMGPYGSKISKHYSYKPQPKVFKLFLNFLLTGPITTKIGIFGLLKIEILPDFFFFSFSLTWDPMVVKIVLNFPPNGHCQITFVFF